MRLKFTLLAIITLLVSTTFAQESGLKGRVLSRNGRTAVENVVVAIKGTDFKAKTSGDGYFELKGVPAGDYRLTLVASEFEGLDIAVKVEHDIKDINALVITPKSAPGEVLDDAIFAEFDYDSSSSDAQALPSSLSASKDLYNSIAR